MSQASMSRAYRFDHRSRSEFISDMRSSHKVEAFIVLRVCTDVFQRTKRWPALAGNGSDITGGFIAEEAKVSSRPDFLVDGQEVEITRSDRKLKAPFFHQKCNKIARCIKSKASLVFVNGVQEMTPFYVWLDHEDLAFLTDKAVKKYGIVGHPTQKGIVNKDSYRYDLDLFEGLWRVLPTIQDKLPESYKPIADLVPWP